MSDLTKDERGKRLLSVIFRHVSAGYTFTQVDMDFSGLVKEEDFHFLLDQIRELEAEVKAYREALGMKPEELAKYFMGVDWDEKSLTFYRGNLIEEMGNFLKYLKAKAGIKQGEGG